MKGVRDTSNKTAGQLLGNGLTYEVPKFQRDYSWDIEQLDDLWQDMLDRISDDDDHYMGYLVLQTNDNEHFIIIDGQQRITTLSIFVLAALKNLQELEKNNIDNQNNKLRREELHRNFIGKIDYTTLVASNKLNLNRHNNKFYKTYLVPLDYIPQRNLNASEKLMKNCFEYFFKKIKNHCQKGEDITTFIKDIFKKLFFTVITVDNDLNAYQVFETLNARGVKLSATDLLKNYLLSLLDKNELADLEITELENIWEEIVETLSESKLPEFLVCYWNSKKKFTRKTNLFKVVKKEISTKTEVMSFIRDLRKNADLYKSLEEPEDKLWRDSSRYKEIQQYLTELKLFKVKSAFSLLMIAYEKLPENDFIKLLKICSIISFRYNVISELNPNEQEIIYNKIAVKINQENKWQKEDFVDIYLADDIFESNFTQKIFKNNSDNKKKIKYILKKIEKQKNGSEIDEEKITIEHIMPQNYEIWGTSDEIGEKSIFRLGNQILLENNLNKEAENKDFAYKKLLYAKSTIISTQEISFYEEWDEDNINNRQKNMAKIAKTIWSF